MLARMSVAVRGFTVVRGFLTESVAAIAVIFELSRSIDVGNAVECRGD